ncbi:MAG TPA: TlpA disulfide reductase family protein [Candidatus Limnocylindria bacterium]|nr:TlpA disulfide reductase family protein [Candidatus Limnocylindria bacterium]
MPIALLAVLVLGTACSATTPSASAREATATDGGTASDKPASGTAVASDAPSASQMPALGSDPLHTLVLTDVRDGTEFTLGELAAEKPVLLEAMAIWCTNCRAQMHRVIEAHERADFHSVGIDVDPSELPADLAAYVEEQGFEWPFAMANPEIATALTDRFGNGFRFPPNTPMALLFPDGSIRALDFGGYDVEALLAEIAAG